MVPVGGVAEGLRRLRAAVSRPRASSAPTIARSGFSRPSQWRGSSSGWGSSASSSAPCGAAARPGVPRARTSSAPPAALPPARRATPRSSRQCPCRRRTPTPAPASLAACTVSGPPHVIGPSATVTAGVEVVRLGDDLALGFAPTDHDAIAVRLDPASLSASATTKAHVRDTVRRVTPLTDAKGALSLVIDADRKNDRLQGRRTVLGDPPVQLGASDGHLAFSRVGGRAVRSALGRSTRAPASTLCAAPPRTPASARSRWRFAAAARCGWAWRPAHATLAPKGDLSHIEGLGTAVGSPAIALGGGVRDGRVVGPPVDRRAVAAALDALRRGRRRHRAPETFRPPAGGKGEQTMSPALTALPGGRFLLVWTEGPASGHDVRALTLNAGGQAPRGAARHLQPGHQRRAGSGRASPRRGRASSRSSSRAARLPVVATPIACGE